MSRVKLFFDQIIVDTNAKPIYFPELGIIVNKSTDQWLYRFSEPEMIPYFYFVLEFDDYKYTNYYLPNTKGYIDKITHRIFNIYMIINISFIIQNGNLDKTLYNSLQYYFLLIQMKKIKKHKSYDKDIINIKNIINCRNSNLIFFHRWFFFRINKICLFDLLKKNLYPQNWFQKYLLKEWVAL